LRNIPKVSYILDSSHDWLLGINDWSSKLNYDTTRVYKKSSTPANF